MLNSEINNHIKNLHEVLLPKTSFPQYLFFIILLIFNIYSEDIDSYIAAVPKVFPPQYTTDKYGKPSGFAIEILEEIAELSNVKIKYIQYDNWHETIDALKEGKVNLIPNLGITKERENELIFTSPIETFPLSIIIRKSTYNIYTIENLKGKNVGTVKANAGTALIKDRYDIKKEVFSNVNEALFSLLSGNCDALIYPGPVIMDIAAKAGLSNRIKITGPPLSEIKRAMAFRKTNTDLKNKFDLAVQEFYGSPQYWNIYKKWHGKPKQYWTLGKVIALMSIIFFIVIIVLIIWRYKSIISLNRKLKSALDVVTYTEQKLQEANDTLESKVHLRTQQLTDANNKLMEALEKVHDLRGLLPICSMCKRVKDDDGYWSQVESYIEGHSHAKFSHGFCPECAEKYKQKHGIK